MMYLDTVVISVPGTPTGVKDAAGQKTPGAAVVEYTGDCTIDHLSYMHNMRLSGDDEVKWHAYIVLPSCEDVLGFSLSADVVATDGDTGRVFTGTLMDIAGLARRVLVRWQTLN